VYSFSPSYLEDTLGEKWVRWKQYAIEVLASAWFTIVAVQFLDSYFFSELRVDFHAAYVVMLVLTCFTFMGRFFVGLKSHKRSQ